EKEDNNFSVNFEVNGKKYIVVTASEGTQGIFRNRVVERVRKPGFLTKQIAVDLPIFLYLTQFFTKQSAGDSYSHFCSFALIITHRVYLYNFSRGYKIGFR